MQANQRFTRHDTVATRCWAWLVLVSLVCCAGCGTSSSTNQTVAPPTTTTAGNSNVATNANVPSNTNGSPWANSNASFNSNVPSNSNDTSGVTTGAVEPDTRRPLVGTILVAKSGVVAGEAFDPANPSAKLKVSVLLKGTNTVIEPKEVDLEGDGVPGVTMPGHVWRIDALGEYWVNADVTARISADDGRQIEVGPVPMAGDGSGDAAYSVSSIVAAPDSEVEVPVEIRSTSKLMRGLVGFEWNPNVATYVRVERGRSDQARISDFYVDSSRPGAVFVRAEWVRGLGGAGEFCRLVLRTATRGGQSCPVRLSSPLAVQCRTGTGVETVKAAARDGQLTVSGGN